MGLQPYTDFGTEIASYHQYPCFVTKGDKMNYKDIRRFSLIVFIGFLVLTALMAIVSVVSGTFGELQENILVTTFTISAASICSMACAAFMEKKKRPALGAAGIVLCAVTAVLFVIGIWAMNDVELYWKTTGTCGVLALAFTHAFLLAFPNLDSRQRWVQFVSFICIGVLAALIIIAIWFHNKEWEVLYSRVLTVTAILVGLETLVIPILMKLRKVQAGGERLVLEKIEANIYRDAVGRKYRLIEIE
jgi:peptidoglycan/LPS O-acetylase OafA/YrhL